MRYLSSQPLASDNHFGGSLWLNFLSSFNITLMLSLVDASMINLHTTLKTRYDG